MRALAKFLGVVSTAALWLSGIGLVLMTVFTAWQVWARYVLDASPSWTEPLSVILMGWFIFLGAAIGVREGYHLGFDVLLVVLPTSVQKVFMTISDLATVFFGCAMAWYGDALVVGTWADQLPALNIPTGITYLPLMVGGILIAVFSLERIARRFAGLEGAGDEYPDFQHMDTAS
ncbi:TRAP transporter small permease [Jiella sp. M17.18]|uniref:TRAP transporter small permease n=1 Tax=Jiella sp. M17.18 TaxID=3234247 RepID=UPI0034DE8B51